mmetsp:Transcript_17036/g.51736  ORF Transcript_17036/g.51736 Transcript_17036/m.51736 type:complete len:269 (-) Transcript_17036:697-1503(-)
MHFLEPQNVVLRPVEEVDRQFSDSKDDQQDDGRDEKGDEGELGVGVLAVFAHQELQARRAFGAADAAFDEVEVPEHVHEVRVAHVAARDREDEERAGGQDVGAPHVPQHELVELLPGAGGAEEVARRRLLQRRDLPEGAAVDDAVGFVDEFGFRGAQQQVQLRVVQKRRAHGLVELVDEVQRDGVQQNFVDVGLDAEEQIRQKHDTEDGDDVGEHADDQNKFPDARAVGAQVEAEDVELALLPRRPRDVAEKAEARHVDRKVVEPARS